MPVIQWLEIRGFRAFTQMQRLDFSAQLALISGPNSHGKTSIVEAIEFLLCGETLRRTFLGGAKAEFEGTLRNAHMAADEPVSVKAGILGTDGIVHVVERILVKDYAAEGDCESELKVDGAPAEDISVTGIGLAEPPLRTPILFQHTVRFALSASPSERARYFRAILEIEDLEVVREEVARLRDELAVPASPELHRLDRLATIEPLKATVMAIRSAETLEELEVALRAALAVAFDELDLDGLDAISSLGQQAALVSAKTDAHGEESFPSAEFIAGEVPSFELPRLGSVGEYEPGRV